MIFQGLSGCSTFFIVYLEELKKVLLSISSVDGLCVFSMLFVVLAVLKAVFLLCFLADIIPVTPFSPTSISY